MLNRSAPNDPRQLQRWVDPLGSVARVGIEACCGAADLGQKLVEQHGWSVALDRAAYIARTKSSPDKSDYRDTASGRSATAGCERCTMR